MKSITVEAKIENVDKVTEFVNEVLEEKECPLKVQMQLDVAIDDIWKYCLLCLWEGQRKCHDTN